MGKALINYFFDTKEEYEAYKPYLKLVGILVLINIMAIAL